jgi:sRNA-binding protein
MSFPKTADCIRRTINNSSSKDYFKFDKKAYNADKIRANLHITSPKLENLLNHIKELDDNDFAKYGKKFKHIIYSDVKNSLSGIKLIASTFKAFGMNNIYNEKFSIDLKKSNDNFALLTSVAIYDKPFPVRLRKEIIKLYNQRPENINGELVRFLLIDQGFKEGIDVYDVKYIHLFDELLTPADEKQAIGRGTRMCGQLGLEFNPELGWPLHVFKYKLKMTDDLKEKYKNEDDDAFTLFLKESKINVKKLFFAAELENICRFGAVDYEINRAIHEFGNENEDNLELPAIKEQLDKFQTFKIKDMYSSLNRDNINEFDLVKKAYYKYGGVMKKKGIAKKPLGNNKNKQGFINKKTNRFIDIKKVKPINKVLVKKLDFIEMRKYIRKYFRIYKWTNIKFANGCVKKDEENKPKKRVVDLTNSQLFVSNFMTAESSYKGILFWHSVGTGKTCSAIATASNTFEKEGYTILWVTRHTLKPDIWKNIYREVCSVTIKEKLEKGEQIPQDISGNFLKYLDNKWIMPISYKQFSNLIAGKNVFYNELVKRNGKSDPLKKTLIIIDEAHKLFAEDTPPNERPNINILKKAIYHSYNSSKENSCKLLLMTATPYTNDPMQLFKLINLLKEDDYFEEDFEKFSQEFLDDNYKFKSGKNKLFLDKITGYISYLNRERDVRQFAYPVIYNRDIKMSSKKDLDGEDNDFYKLFFDDIRDYVAVSISGVKAIITYLKLKAKPKKTVNDIISQEEAFDLCMSKNKDKSSKKDAKEPNFFEDLVDELGDLIKEQIKADKEKEKNRKKKEKEDEKEEKRKEKEAKKKEKEEAKAKKEPKAKKGPKANEPKAKTKSKSKSPSPKSEPKVEKKSNSSNIGSLSNFNNLYEILEVPTTATISDIKRAYRKLVLLYHPDKTGSNARAERRFKSITEAHFILSNENYKNYYDSQMNSGRPLKEIVQSINLLISENRL